MENERKLEKAIEKVGVEKINKIQIKDLNGNKYELKFSSQDQNKREEELEDFLVTITRIIFTTTLIIIPVIDVIAEPSERTIFSNVKNNTMNGDPISIIVT